MAHAEGRNIATVRKYFDACNSGNLDDLLSTMTPDVCHYFLPASVPPIKGAEHLARYWCKYQRALDPVWAIDRIVASGDEVVSEWSCVWTPPGTAARLMLRGTEWYVMRDGLIAEVRAYFIFDPKANTELPAFPYAARGYLAAEGRSV